MKRSLAFYRDILGFEVQGSWAPEGNLYWADLRHGDVAIMLNAKYEIDEQPASDDPASATWHHDTVLYLNTDNVDVAYEELRSRVPKLQPPTTAFYGMKQIHVTDPDGFCICIQQRAPEEAK